MKLSDVQVGDVWYLDDPKRIARVESSTKASIFDARTKQNNYVDGYLVTATVPTVPISGFLSAEEADTNQYLQAQSKKAREPGQPDTTIWQEIWAERMVHPFRHVAKFNCWMRDESAPKIPELYCCETKNRTQQHDRTSPIAKKAIEGKKIPAKKVPDGIFETQKAKVLV